MFDPLQVASHDNDEENPDEGENSFHLLCVGSSWKFSEASTTSSIILFQESSALVIAANASNASSVMSVS